MALCTNFIHKSPYWSSLRGNSDDPISRLNIQVL